MRSNLGAWAAALLASLAPRVVWSALTQQDPPLALVFAQLLAVVVLSQLPIVRPVRSYVVLLVGMVAGDALYQVVRSTSAWQAWWAGASEHERLFIDPFFETLPSAGVALTLVRSGLTREELSLRIGELSRVLRIGGLAVTWWTAAPVLALLLAGPLLAQLSFTVRPDPGALPRALAFIPAAVVFAALNAFLEEFRFRAAPLACLVPVVGEGHALLVTAVLFGIGHFYGHPAGLSGVVLAGLAGWLLGLAMRGTRGIVAPWLVHGAQDVLIFMAVVMSER